mgnify:CR=1 FL=1
MSKVSEKCKAAVLNAIIDSELSGEYTVINLLSDNISFSTFYSETTVDKAIGALLKEGKLCRDIDNSICVPTPPKTYDFIPADGMPSKEQILEAVSTSPEAAAVLKKLFPRWLGNPGLLKFTYGTFPGMVGDSIQELNDTHNMLMQVAKGLAPTEKLVRKTITLDPDRHVMVVYDDYGKEVYRSKASERIFFGFEKAA